MRKGLRKAGKRAHTAGELGTEIASLFAKDGLDEEIPEICANEVEPGIAGLQARFGSLPAGKSTLAESVRRRLVSLGGIELPGIEREPMRRPPHLPRSVRNRRRQPKRGEAKSRQSMSVYRQQPLKLDKVRTYPLASRRSKVSVEAFGRLPRRTASVREWVKSLPKILAGENFRAAIEALQQARRRKRPIVWGLGGHVIKVGLGPILIELMRRGYATAFALNGAALIHDFEIALAGSTSEDVPAALGEGQFGMAEETGRYLNEAIAAGDGDGVGIGEAVGRFLNQRRPAAPGRFRKFSLLAEAYKHRAPVTVHEAIGTDIIHNHPAVDPRALGSASHRDFLLLAGLVREMERGGVYLNCGSAVILPEVFLKCVSLAANLGHPPRRLVTINLDFIQHYRPLENVIRRPTAIAGGRGYALTGHHELMIPLLAAALA